MIVGGVKPQMRALPQGKILLLALKAAI